MTRETYHAVDADILGHLGSSGFLINVSRGALVETASLVQALSSGHIAGAGLDVFEDEPNVPADLCRLQNVVLSPHVGGFSPEAQYATIELLRRNLDAHFGNQALLSEIAETNVVNCSD